MEYTDIIYEVDNYIGTITLNRPQSLNAFTDTLLTEWVDAIESAKRDPNVRVLIVTGAGFLLRYGRQGCRWWKPGSAPVCPAKLYATRCAPGATGTGDL